MIGAAVVVGVVHCQYHVHQRRQVPYSAIREEVQSEPGDGSDLFIVVAAINCMIVPS